MFVGRLGETDSGGFGTHSLSVGHAETTHSELNHALGPHHQLSQLLHADFEVGLSRYSQHRSTILLIGTQQDTPWVCLAESLDGGSQVRQVIGILHLNRSIQERVWCDEGVGWGHGEWRCVGGVRESPCIGHPQALFDTLQGNKIPARAFVDGFSISSNQNVRSGYHLNGVDHIPTRRLSEEHSHGLSTRSQSPRIYSAERIEFARVGWASYHFCDVDHEGTLRVAFSNSLNAYIVLRISEGSRIESLR